jgi:hypothetical protein
LASKSGAGSLMRGRLADCSVAAVLIIFLTPLSYGDFRVRNIR